jgi:inhibitor of KinA
LDKQVDIFSLGDSAVTIELGNSISRELNAQARHLQRWLADHPFEGLLDVTSAYSSVSVFYDPVILVKKYRPPKGASNFVQQRLREAWDQSSASTEPSDREIVRIPVCYGEDFGPDMDFVSRTTQLSQQEIVHLHCARRYYVYMIGFLPGFTYMAEVDQRLISPRKKLPVHIPAGSVGIAGSQTGIYPFACPGGWQIIGRTPVSLFNPKQGVPVILESGDLVEFYPISKEEFAAYDGAICRLPLLA